MFDIATYLQQLMFNLNEIIISLSDFKETVSKWKLLHLILDFDVMYG